MDACLPFAGNVRRLVRQPRPDGGRGAGQKEDRKGVLAGLPEEDR